MVKKLVQREISFIVDSNEASGALEKTSDGSAFTVQLDQPIFIPSNAINPTLDIEESAVWYTTPNIYDASDGSLQNNRFTFEYSRQALRISLDLTIPRGVYSLSDIEVAMNKAIREATNNFINTDAISLSESPDGGKVNLQVLYLDNYEIDATNSDFTIFYGASTTTLSIPFGIYNINELQTQINDIIKTSTSISTDFLELTVINSLGFNQSTNSMLVIWTDGVNVGSIQFPVANGIGTTIGLDNGVLYNYNTLYTSDVRNGLITWETINSLADVLGFDGDEPYFATIVYTGTTIPRINAYNFYLLRMDIVDKGIRFNNNFSHIVEVILIDVEPGQQILTRPVHPPTSEVQHLAGRPINRIRVELLKDDLTPADTNGENYYARVAIKYWEPIEINL